MKKALLILALIPMMAISQSFKDLIKKYEDYCNETVLDTIQQSGTVTETFEQIQGSNYWAIKLDTVWDSPDCPEFKITASLRFYNGYPTYNFDSSTNTTVWTGPISGTENGEKKRRWITRDYICECKRREVEAFSEDFWKWIKKQ